MITITSKEWYELCAPADDPEDPDVLGTVEDARNAGFLCVISLLSTLRRPFVTSEPRLSSANTAATPPAVAAAGAEGGGGGPGGGGGGGGGGAPLAAAEGGAAALYSEMDMPCDMIVYQPMHGWETRELRAFAFQTRPVVWCSITYCFISSKMAVNALTHSTCALSLPRKSKCGNTRGS